MATRRTRIKRPVIPVPKSLEEAAQFLSQIAEEQRAIEAIRAELNTQVKELQTSAMTKTKTHQETLDERIEGLFAFAQTNREALTEGGKQKTVKLPTGTFSWRTTPPKVTLRNVKSVLVNLKSLGLDRFIRIQTTEEVNKAAMLKEPEVAQTVKGVSITQLEEFVVKPTELEVEIPIDIKKLKKAVSQ